MEIDVESIKNGGRNGETVWICHYHRPDLDKKPLRNVPPTKVVVCSNDDLPANKRVYYSKSHFRPINTKGKLTAKILSPVDNTGYRSLSGTSLHAFDNESECVQSWNAQIKAHEAEVDVRIATAADYWKAEKEKLVNMLK